MTSRFKRQPTKPTNESVNTQKKAKSVPQNHALAWGFEDLDKVKTLKSSNWANIDCPKCRVILKNSKDKHPINSLMINLKSGLFWCAECGYHGNISSNPATNKDSWLGIFRSYITSFNNQAPEFIGSRLSDGIKAPAWINKSWVDCWHVFARNQKELIENVFILNSKDNSWHHYNFTIPTPLNWDEASKSDRIIVSTHPEDFHTLQQLGYLNAICLPVDLSHLLPTSHAWKSLSVMEEKMEGISDIVLALRSDSFDRALEEELGRRMDRERCFRVRWRQNLDFSETIDNALEETDINKAIETYGIEAVKLMIDGASPFPVVGVYELDDIEDRFDALYETGLTPGNITGWPSLDQKYTVKTGQWTLVTGIPGHGKSSFLDALLVNLASLHNWRFGLFSPENQPIERHFASLMEKKLGKSFSKGTTSRITKEEKDTTKRWLNDKFKIILPDEEEGVWTLDAVLKLAKTLVYRHGIRGLVIDPWNELDHVFSGNKKETNHISESLTKIRRFARLYDVHIWIVAHPTKLEKKSDGKYPVPTPYDVSGGAHWRNKADNAIAIYRNIDEDDYDICDIYIQKIRFKEIGSVGRVSLRCVYNGGNYIDDIDQGKREYAILNGHYSQSTTMRCASPRKYSEKAFEISNELDF